MALSAVAGILDPKGGLRVVVGPRKNMAGHVAAGEKLFVVPGYWKQEPVPWHEIPVVVRRVELYIEWWVTSRNDPSIFRDPLIRNYINNPSASHHLHPEWPNYGLLAKARIA